MWSMRLFLILKYNFPWTYKSNYTQIIVCSQYLMEGTWKSKSLFPWLYTIQTTLLYSFSPTLSIMSYWCLIFVQGTKDHWGKSMGGMFSNFITTLRQKHLAKNLVEVSKLWYILACWSQENCSTSLSFIPLFKMEIILPNLNVMQIK